MITFYGTYLVLNDTWTLGTMMAFGAVAGGFLGPVSSLVFSGPAVTDDGDLPGNG